MSVITQRGNLAEIVTAHLAERIAGGRYRPGERLPSGARLCEEFGVSRSVIREAVAALKTGGQVTARQGAGVFVAEREGGIAFEVARIKDIRSAMQILELRLGVEAQSAALAASRRTPETLAEIARCYDRLDRLETRDPEAEAKADFRFHLAIARATANRHFPRFLEAVAREVSFELTLKRRGTGDDKAYLRKVNKEHAAILAAITQGDARAATAAMRCHLEDSLSRYARLLDQ